MTRPDTRDMVRKLVVDAVVSLANEIAEAIEELGANPLACPWTIGEAAAIARAYAAEAPRQLLEVPVDHS